MRVLAIVHQRDAGPGVFAEAVAVAGSQLDEWTLAERPEPAADPLGYEAVLVLGGAMNVDEGERHGWIATEEALLRELLTTEVPLLGLCLGGQLLAAAASAQPRRASHPEIGWHQVEVTAEGVDDALLGPLAPAFEAFQWHSYEFPLPPGAVPLARSEVCLQACRLGERAWALQFHPEVTPPTPATGSTTTAPTPTPSASASTPPSSAPRPNRRSAPSIGSAGSFAVDG